MKLRTSILSAFVALAMLGTGCSQTMGLSGIDTTGRTEAQIAAEVCELFRNQTYDSRVDSKPTSDQIKSFNRARDAYCKGEEK
jgi:hypothetical protein